MESEILKTLNIEKSFKNAEVFTVKNSNTALVRATGTYITIDEFKKIFEYIGDLVEKIKLQNWFLIKRNSVYFINPLWNGILLNGKKRCTTKD